MSPPRSTSAAVCEAVLLTSHFLKDDQTQFIRPRVLQHRCKRFHPVCVCALICMFVSAFVHTHTHISLCHQRL